MNNISLPRLFFLSRRPFFFFPLLSVAVAAGGPGGGGRLALDPNPGLIPQVISVSEFQSSSGCSLLKASCLLERPLINTFETTFRTLCTLTCPLELNMQRRPTDHRKQPLMMLGRREGDSRSGPPRRYQRRFGVPTARSCLLSGVLSTVGKNDSQGHPTRQGMQHLLVHNSEGHSPVSELARGNSSSLIRS